MKNLETIEMKIVRESIGGGFYTCHSDCSFFRSDCVGFTECVLTGIILGEKKYKGKFVCECDYKIGLITPLLE